MANVLIEFENFPREREIVGNLLIAYGEIEWALLGCLEAILNVSKSECTRILFRINGEGARMGVADALVRPALTKANLGGQWGCAIGAAKQCKNIRNTYAHCHWRLMNGVLRFIKMDEEASSSSDGPLIVDAIPLKLKLLEQQFEYFKYALDWLYFLPEEYKIRMGRSSNHDLTAPKSIPEPPVYDRPKKEAQNLLPDAGSDS